MNSLQCVVVSVMAGAMALGAGAVDVHAAAAGAGQGFPNKPIRLVTGLAGGAADVLARLTVQGISGPLGQTVVVDNRGGGLIPGEIVSKTPPDGYTLLVTGGNLWITALLQKAPYDAVRDFSPISVLVRTVTVLVVHPSVAATSVKELIAIARAKPGQLNYGSGATGGAGHLAGELLKSMAGVNIVHVPYKGNAPQVTGLIMGEVHMVIGDVSLVMPHVKSGKLRALAVTSAEPSAMVPGLPTVAASGLPGYESGAIYGMWAPAKTPKAIIQRLNQEVVRFLRTPEAKEKFFTAGAEIVANSPEEFAAIIKSDIAKWGKLIRDVGIKGG